MDNNILFVIQFAFIELFCTKQKVENNEDDKD